MRRAIQEGIPIVEINRLVVPEVNMAHGLPDSTLSMKGRGHGV